MVVDGGDEPDEPTRRRLIRSVRAATEPLGHVDAFDCRGDRRRLEERLDCLTESLIMRRSAVIRDRFRIREYFKQPESSRTGGASVEVEAKATGFRARRRDHCL